MNGELAIRDIHLPESVPWWPLAPGWWLLILIGVFLGLLIYQKKRKKAHLHVPKRDPQKVLLEARQLLEVLDGNEDNQQVIKEISILLRRTAISLYGRNNIAGLSGKEWLHFLDKKGSEAAGRKSFLQGKGHILIAEPYKKYSDYDRQELVTLTQQWLIDQGREHA